MALVKFGGIITDSRGAIEGIVYKLTRWGHIVTKKTSPSPGPTPAQSLQRTYLEETVREWDQLLSESERQDWISLAATVDETDPWGTTYPLTGITLYTRINTKRRYAGLSTLTTAPGDQVVTAPLTVDLTAPAGTALEIAWTATPAPANHRVRIYATAPLNPGVSVAQRLYGLVLQTAAAESSPVDFTTEYQARYPLPFAGKKVFAQLSFWNSTNGAESPRLDANVLA